MFHVGVCVGLVIGLVWTAETVCGPTDTGCVEELKAEIQRLAGGRPRDRVRPPLRGTEQAEGVRF